MLTLDEFLDETLGKVGTPKRDLHERNYKRWRRANDIADKVTSHWPQYMRIFWTRPIHDGDLSIRGWLDIMSFSYLGDFMFHGQPVTQDYADSWMSKVHFPRKVKR